MKRKWPYIAIPMLGAIPCLWYVKCTTHDIVYMGYIRLVNTYLPGMMDSDKFFMPDVLTRIPINYLDRMINVLFFHYSTTFDMVLGVLGLGLTSGALACYCRDYSLNWFWLLLLPILMLGLNKWEMLTNGTGWMRFLAIACFLCHYLIPDRVWYGTEKKHDKVKPMVPPFVITLGVVGPYCAIYMVVLVSSYGYYMIGKVKRSHVKRPDYRYLLYIVCALIPLFLYLRSSSCTVEGHADMQNLPLVPALLGIPGYFLHFSLKSLANDMLGGEVLKTWIEHGVISDETVYMLSVLVLFAALLALWMNFRYHLYKKTISPLMSLVKDGLSHLLILYSGWGFMNENYGMSSRHALRFQLVTLGVMLTTALAWERIRRQMTGVLAELCYVTVMSGSIITTTKEIETAPYREEYGQKVAIVALQYKEVSDKVLRETFDCRKTQEGNGAKVRVALGILDENGLNIYRRNAR